MSGRFFAIPFFSAVILIVCSGRSNFRYNDAHYLAILLVVIGFSVLWPYSPLISGKGYRINDLNYTDKYRIADERGSYYRWTGLLRNVNNKYLDTLEWVKIGKRACNRKVRFFVTDAVGFQGFYAGPQVHLLDYYALGDPLLAHLPSHKSLYQRIGHFQRLIPDGYYATLLTGKNIITDKNLAQYYEKLRYITRGDLFDIKRLETIWDLNRGKYNYLINYEYYRNAPEIKHMVEHIRIGVNYEQQKRYDDAEREYELALRFNSNRPLPHIQLGELYLRQKQYAKAEQEFKLVLALNSDNYLHNARAYNNLGQLNLVLDRKKEAINYFENAIRIDPLNEEYERNLKDALANNF